MQPITNGANPSPFGATVMCERPLVRWAMSGRMPRSTPPPLPLSVLPRGRNQWGRNPSVPCDALFKTLGGITPTDRSYSSVSILASFVVNHPICAVDQHKEHSVAFYKHATSRPPRVPRPCPWGFEYAQDAPDSEFFIILAFV